jgi:predicted nucleic acid-binding protein
MTWWSPCLRPHPSGLPATCPAENEPHAAFSADAFTEYLRFVPAAHCLGRAACRHALSSRPVENRAANRDALLAAVVVLASTESTAVLYGAIHASLAMAGTPIPQNDIWIAAVAREHELPLVTRDAHFPQVQGLVILTW